MASPVGTLLARRYRLEARIGTGGMSTVYRASDSVLERQVAIKLMHREIAEDSDQLERFRREARAVAQLNHPHIVTVIDAGEDEHMPFIVLEYVEGETLKERIRRLGPLPIPEAVAYAIEIARALGAAHERGIVHRDIKPQNVLVSAEGSAKVTDFGIARTLAEEGLTADGRVLGTTDYVSPEQALGRPVGGQSDLYSLGVVLFEMLTGSPPFRGENEVAVAMRHVREELPDVQRLRPEVSAALAAVVDHAVAKDLDRRVPDAATLVAELEDALAIETARAGGATGEATTVLRTLPDPARRRLPLHLRVTPALAVGALLATAVAVIAVLALARDNAERGTRPPDIPRQAGVTPINLGAARAEDYDPFGGDGEHPEEARAAIDDDPNSAWTTERYSDRRLTKPGVGLYVDAAPGVAARRLVLRTQDAGWSGAVFAADRVPEDVTAELGGWTRLATLSSVGSRETVSLAPDRRFRHYLVWIDALPPGEQQASISSLALFR